MLMQPTEFDQLVNQTRLRGRAMLAAKLVMTQGYTRYKAAQEYGIQRSVVNKAVNRLQDVWRGLYRKCPCCGQDIP